MGGQSAEGFNINVAWNWDTMGDAEYLSAFHYIIMPVAYEVKPVWLFNCVDGAHNNCRINSMRVVKGRHRYY